MNAIKLYNEMSGETFFIASDAISAENAEKIAEWTISALRKSETYFHTFCKVMNFYVLDSDFCVLYPTWDRFPHGAQISVNVISACSARF